MDLSVEKSKTKIKNIRMVYVAIFGLTILLSLVKMYDTSLCFVVSMLVISFMCGYQHLIIYMAALVLTSLLFYDSYMEVLISLTSVVMMQVLMSFKFIKSKHITLIIYICVLLFFIIFSILCFINGILNNIYMPLLIITFVSLITCILLQQIIYVGHRQMMIGKIKLDYRKIKRVTYPKSSKLRFIYGQKSYETSLRFIDDFKLKKALQQTR